MSFSAEHSHQQLITESAPGPKVSVRSADDESAPVRKERHSLTRSPFWSLDFYSRRGDLRAVEADVLLQDVLLAAVDRRSRKVISVQSLAFSDRPFLCLPRLRPPSTVT